jgi:hypothetical protein
MFRGNIPKLASSSARSLFAAASAIQLIQQRQPKAGTT